MSKTITLKLSQISRPTDLQMREHLVTDHIHDMTEVLETGIPLPPVSVVQEGKTYWLWDGHHRVAAYETADVLDVPAVVTEQGDRLRARWLAYSANKEHTGLKRSLADRRKAVEQALEDQPGMSNRAIAEHVGVSDHLVSKMRGDQKPSGGAQKGAKTRTCPQSEDGNGDSAPDIAGDQTETRTGKDGKEYPAEKPTTGRGTAKRGGKHRGGEGESEGPASPVEAEAARRKAKPNGAETVSAADRKKAYRSCGVVVRFLEDIGKLDQHRAALEAIMSDIQPGS